MSSRSGQLGPHAEQLMDLAAHGPFRVPQGVAYTGRAYATVATMARNLVERGRLVRLDHGLYALAPGASWPPATIVIHYPAGRPPPRIVLVEEDQSHVALAAIG